jgi:anaerobic dimethyl sulfoxide reductase subunit B (iron-sulfur subunit)
MGRQVGLVVNLELCIGCLACEVACKQERDLPGGKNGIIVRTLGPYELEGELAMDFLPLATEECNLCAERTLEGARPFCAEICPTQALDLHDEEEILNVIRERKDRYQVLKIKG